MKCVKTLLVSLAISLLPCAAQAADDKDSFFHCGVDLGATSKIQVRESDNRKYREYEPQRELNRFAPKATDESLYLGSSQKRTGERRLPPMFTVARFRCSWL
jgi:hypothetical protein